MHNTKWKDNLKKLHTVWFQPYKTTEIVKRLVVVRGQKRGRDEQAEHRGFFGLYDYSVWHTGGYESLYSYPNT